MTSDQDRAHDWWHSHWNVNGDLAKSSLVAEFAAVRLDEREAGAGMSARPPYDDLWRAIAARLVFSDLLRDDVTGQQIRHLADAIYWSAKQSPSKPEETHDT